MFTKEQKDILDDIEYSCDTLKKTNRGLRILRDVLNMKWNVYEQRDLIIDGLKELGREKELNKILKHHHANYLHDFVEHFLQNFQDHEALYLIAAGLIADGQDDIAFELANDLNDYCKKLKESRLRKGRLVKESRLSPRFTELLKEAYGRLDTDYSKLVFKCVEVTVNDKRYNASCKEGDVLDFDGLVELAKDYEPINGNVEFDVRTNQDTAEECLILSLSTSDVSGTEEDENGYEYEEGEELLVAEYWFTVRVEDRDSLNDIGDEVIKQCYGD